MLSDPGLDSVKAKFAATGTTGHSVLNLDRTLIGDDGVGSVAGDSPDSGVYAIEGSYETATALDDEPALGAPGIGFGEGIERVDYGEHWRAPVADSLYILSTRQTVKGGS